MTTPRWAYLFEHPGADPVADRWALSHPDSHATMVAIPDLAAAPAVAAGLAASGVRLIELCGGFGPADVAAVRRAVGDEVAVGSVAFAMDSLAAAAAYAASASGGDA
ncbi:DUF6506 family protein [Nocardioides sp. CFH 31398]|uniref:DUF6506 family protein n=1 Tax=Nocardioides sp. CFH 31398 TaxID=2919579 RepID=UPI001F0566AF|nr:DUF6506 family protein [Nocardioides sp. CFH 31398]MCH1865432.1 DUF6506 family protein [Nocardioides sp. CFH 31398]